MRYAGRNWEGRTWVCPASVRSLGQQVDTEYPDRPRGTDGTVASKTHDQVNPNSDHRPHPFEGPGIVRGMDVTVTPEQGAEITEALRLSRDSRIKYVIYNRRSFRPPSWEWKPYDLAPHDKHFHVSTQSDSDNDGSLWALKLEDDMALTPDEQDQLSAFLGYIAAANSNVGFVTQAIEDIREKNAAGGYVPKGTVVIDEAAVKAIINGSQIVAP